MSTIPVNVLVKDDDLGRFDEVVAAAKGAGLKIDQALADIGVVSGAIAEADVSTLQQVPGVAAVETSREIKIPPPDSDVQ